MLIRVDASLLRQRARGNAQFRPRSPLPMGPGAPLLRSDAVAVSPTLAPRLASLLFEGAAARSASQTLSRAPDQCRFCSGTRRRRSRPGCRVPHVVDGDRGGVEDRPRHRRSGRPGRSRPSRPSRPMSETQHNAAGADDHPRPRARANVGGQPGRRGGGLTAPEAAPGADLTDDRVGAVRDGQVTGRGGLRGGTCASVAR